jgi:hypothetical protein
VDSNGLPDECTMAGSGDVRDRPERLVRHPDYPRAGGDEGAETPTALVRQSEMRRNPSIHGGGYGGGSRAVSSRSGPRPWPELPAGQRDSSVGGPDPPGRDPDVPDTPRETRTPEPSAWSVLTVGALIIFGRRRTAR